MLVLVFVSCVLLCMYVNMILKNKKYPKPPMYPGAKPIIGHTFELMGNNEHMCRLLYSIGEESNKKGGVLLLRVGWDDYYVVTDPEDFNTAANQCLKKHYSYQFLDPWLGDGMITGKDTAVWRKHRKLLNPAFSQHVIDGFLPIFNLMATQLVENLKKEVGRGPFDHSVYLDAISLESICQTAFGLAAGEAENFDTGSYMHAAQQMLHISAERVLSFWGHSDALFSLSALKKKQNKIVDDLNKFCDAYLKLCIDGSTWRASSSKYKCNFSSESQRLIIIEHHLQVLLAKKKKLRDEESVNGRRFKAFMDLALELSDKGALTEKEVWEEMNTIILAGYETTGNTLMYTLLLLGSHANVQNKVYEELQRVFGDSDRDVNRHDLPELVYLEAVIKESLRLYCITPVMLRTADRDVTLKNYTIPSGSYCLLFNCSIHYHPIWGPDAQEFRPERWLDPSAMADPKSAIHTAFTSFGVGKRLCIGKNYAMMSMKTTLAYVLRHYRVASDVTQLKLKIDPLLKPISGHHIALQSRN